MRLFAAIELPEASRTALHDLILKLRSPTGGVSWVKPENMHLTLRFYGDVSEGQLPALKHCLTESLATHEAPTLHVRGVGAFPSFRKPSIVWAGIETLSGDLSGLQRVTERAAHKIGLAPERHPFHPHVTLARLRKTATTSVYASLLRPYQDPECSPDFGPAFRAGKITLFSSLLTPRGPVYTILEEIMLL